MAYRRTDRVARRLAARRDAILAAAREVAEEAGMAAVQIVPVAERAKIAAGTVYRYFPSKGDLIAELVQRVSQRELEAMRQAAGAAPGPLSAIAAAVAALSARALAQRRLISGLSGEPVDAETETARGSFRSTLSGELSGLVQAASAAGLIPSDQSPALLAPALIGAMLEGLVGPLAPEFQPGAAQRETVQSFTLLALRALGVSDARARGLVVQISPPILMEGAA